jgi:hypothetical protein
MVDFQYVSITMLLCHPQADGSDRPDDHTDRGMTKKTQLAAGVSC